MQYDDFVSSVRAAAGAPVTRPRRSFASLAPSGWWWPVQMGAPLSPPTGSRITSGHRPASAAREAHCVITGKERNWMEEL